MCRVCTLFIHAVCIFSQGFNIHLAKVFNNEVRLYHGAVTLRNFEGYYLV